MSDLIDTPRDRGNFEELARRANKIRRQAKRIEELEAEVKRLTMMLDEYVRLDNAGKIPLEPVGGAALKEADTDITTIEIDFEDEEFMWVAVYAHERDITLNQAINDIMSWYVKRVTDDATDK